LGKTLKSANWRNLRQLNRTYRVSGVAPRASDPLSSAAVLSECGIDLQRTRELTVSSLPTIEDFIQLSCLNRNVSIVIDSDCEKEDENLAQQI
jgi:hypothetical protein